MSLKSLLVLRDGYRGIIAYTDLISATSSLFAYAGTSLFVFDILDGTADTDVSLESDPRFLMASPSGFSMWYRPESVVRAWLGAKLVSSDALELDPIDRSLSPASWSPFQHIMTAKSSDGDAMGFLAAQLLIRQARPRTVPMATALKPMTDLVRSRNRDAAMALEDLAWSIRDIPRWRFAMAVADGREEDAQKWERLVDTQA